MAARVVAAMSASAAGVCVVSYAGNAVETLDEPPKFQTSGERFDQSTFKGRWFKMLRNFDPSTLLHSNDRVRVAQANLKAWSEGASKMSDAELWNERKIVESSVHPDTNDIIPQPFRMAGYTPFNGPVCVAMLLAKSTPYVLFWNWVNQSQNAMVNYFNRNASSNMSNETLAKSYAGAVGGALCVALGVSTLIKKSFAPVKAAQMLTFVAFPSSVVASSSNAFIMRSPEMETGIALYDEHQNLIKVPSKALSKNAARKAVKETVLSRVVLQIPTFFVPPIILMLPPIASAIAASAMLNVTVTAFLTTTAFGLGLPAAVAVFPQTGEIAVSELEDEYREEAEKLGLTSLFYNKGL